MLDNRTVFNTYIMPATMETFAEMIRLFNAASNNSIVLDAGNFSGNFKTQAFFDSVMSGQRRVSRNGPNTEAPKTYITDHTKTDVKVAGGFGPIVYEPSEMTWLREPTATGIELASRGFASALLLDQINTALGAVVGAISNQPDTVYGSASEVLTYDTINLAHSRFGASSSLLRTDFMSGLQYHKFVSQNLKNAPSLLFEAGNVRIVDILGKTVVVVDAPALTDTIRKVSRVVSLAAGAVTVSDSRDIITNIDTTNGLQRIETTFQADYTFNLSLKGYSWDTATGGSSPDDSELYTGANWDRVSGPVHTTAGVLAIGL
jgi:hypothetical protein